jgi:hypothetical protein
MTEAELKTRSNVYNKVTKEKQFIHELVNSVRNNHIIMKAFEDGRAVDLSAAPKHTGGKCLILGSGPSLDDAMPYLKDWKGGIICTTSHATTLIYNGIEPDYILALDPFARWKEIKGIDWSQTKTKLITCPTVWPDLIENWPNEMLLYRQNLQEQSFYANELLQIYSTRKNIPGMGERDFEFKPQIKTQLTLFSCSPPAQLFAAQCLDYDTCYLVGCDFAYNTEKMRFTAWFKYSGEWEEIKKPYIPSTEKIESEGTNATERDVVTNNGLLATPQMLFYKKNMISAIRLSMQNVIVIGKGSITELPVITPEDLIKKQDYKAPRMKPSEMKKRLEKYLASVGGYVVVSESNNLEALTFIECERPEIDLVEFMAQMKLPYDCDTCGCGLKLNEYNSPKDLLVEMEKAYQAKEDIYEELYIAAKDEIMKRAKKITDHTGDTCPQCNKGKLYPKIKVDIDKNMNRIRRYK